MPSPLRSASNLTFLAYLCKERTKTFLSIHQQNLGSLYTQEQGHTFGRTFRTQFLLFGLESRTSRTSENLLFIPRNVLPFLSSISPWRMAFSSLSTFGTAANSSSILSGLLTIAQLALAAVAYLLRARRILDLRLELDVPFLAN